jgi:hypothetical protein
MKHSEKIAPLAAVIGALSTLVCCLPLGIAGAAGAAGFGRRAGAPPPVATRVINRTTGYRIRATV